MLDGTVEAGHKRQTMVRAMRLLVVGAAVAGAIACGRGPAEQAVNAANEALAQVRPEIEKYAPDELKALTRSVATVKAEIDRGSYKAALASARALRERIEAGAATARKNKDDLAASFGQLRTAVPARMGALENRLTKLAAASTLPADLDQATVEAARANLESVTRNWTEAQSKFDEGNLTAAVAQGNGVKTRVEEMAEVFLAPAPRGK